MSIEWSGVFPAATTEFAADGALSIRDTARHLEEMIRAGVHGLVMLGTVGENTSLGYDEKLDVLGTAVELSGGRIPVLTGVAEFTTATACRFARDAQRAGVDGLMVLPAMVYKSDPRETMAHFRAVSRASDLPVMCYNNPGVYGVDLTPELCVALADEPNIVAIKESSEDVRRITDLRNLTGDRFILFAGVDDLVLEATLLGGQGWVSGLANALPRESVYLWDLLMARELDKALRLYRWFTPVLHLDTSPKLVQFIKLADAAAGTGAEHVRAPRLAIEGEERQRILAIVHEVLATRPNCPNVGAPAVQEAH